MIVAWLYLFCLEAWRLSQPLDVQMLSLAMQCICLQGTVTNFHPAENGKTQHTQVEQHAPIGPDVVYMPNEPGIGSLTGGLLL